MFRSRLYSFFSEIFTLRDRILHFSAPKSQFTCEVCKCSAVPDAERTWVSDSIEEAGYFTDTAVCLTCRGKYKHIINESPEAFAAFLKALDEESSR